MKYTSITKSTESLLNEPQTEYYRQASAPKMKATAAPILSDLDLDDPFSRAIALWLDPSLLKATPLPSHQANMPSISAVLSSASALAPLLFQLLTDFALWALWVFELLELLAVLPARRGASGVASSGVASSLLQRREVGDSVRHGGEARMQVPCTIEANSRVSIIAPRRLLNLGHGLGHGLGHRRLRHGLG